MKYVLAFARGVAGGVMILIGAALALGKIHISIKKLH